jgi:hypothetical protein
VDAGNVIKVDKDEKKCHEVLKPESLEDVDTSGGPLGQVISFLFELLFSDFLSRP